MPTWTFTTTDPAQALAVSQMILHHRLHSFTEKETADGPPAPVKAAARPKAKPVDHGCWRDPEARRVRTKVQGWANANVRKAGRPFSYHKPERAYADALGITLDQANAKIRAHYYHLAAFEAELRGGRR